MSQAEIEIIFDDAEARLERLKARYEQWFQGVERVPPLRFREQLERILREMRRRQPNNTMQRFRFQTLFQRWTTMCTYWDRITRQIEEGTYRRDVMKVKRRRAQREAPARDAQRPDGLGEVHEQNGVALELDLDSVDFDLDAEVDAAMSAMSARETAARTFSKPAPSVGRPVPLPLERPPAPPPPKRPPIRPEAVRAAALVDAPRAPVKPALVEAPRTPAKPPPSTGLSRDEMRVVYERYVAARKQNNERVDNVKYEKLAASIEKMVPKLQQKHQGKKIDFEVVVRDGRVGLKPVAKK